MHQAAHLVRFRRDEAAEVLHAVGHDGEAKALQALGDRRVMQRAGKAYVPYMEEIFKHAETVSIELFGYEIKQVLLLHASALNADYFNQLALMIKKRGYNFISLPQALEDEAFIVPNSYVGPAGLSWFYRWAVGMEKDLSAAPPEPEFVMRLLDQYEL